MYVAEIASEVPAEIIVWGGAVFSFKPSYCWNRLMELSWGI